MLVCHILASIQFGMQSTESNARGRTTSTREGLYVGQHDHHSSRLFVYTLRATVVKQNAFHQLKKTKNVDVFSHFEFNLN